MKFNVGDLLWRTSKGKSPHSWLLEVVSISFTATGAERLSIYHILNTWMPTFVGSISSLIPDEDFIKYNYEILYQDPLPKT